ncbi:glutathione S-transferase family protein [Halioglobus maricola]|nr:glutathione S-transferase family protein [Halioglobus maricola]
MALIEHPRSPIAGKLEGVHLFHYDGAPCAQRVRFALHEKGLSRGREVKFDAGDPVSCAGQQGAWVSRQVSLVKKDHLTEAYALIQPNLVVPALVHDGRLHIESMDIVEYLDEAFGGAPLVPKNDTAVMEDATGLTRLGKELHRSIRFVTFRWGLRGLARLSKEDEEQLRDLLKNGNDTEQLVNFYEGYDRQSIPETIYEEHLEKLNAAFRDHEHRLSDGRDFLTGSDLTMADVIWAMKTLRLIECGYPFEQCFPLYFAWFQRISQRPSFREGVMGKHRLMSSAFKFKARLENLLGIGLKREVLMRVT